MNNIVEIPKCPACKINNVKYDRRFYKTLCENCEGTEEGRKARQEKYEETFAKNHNGFINAWQLDKTKETMKKKFIDNFGADHFMKTEKGKGILKKALSDKYGEGIENSWKIPRVIEGIAQKNLKNHGVRCILQLPENRAKLNEVLKTKEHKEKRKSMFKEKHGVESNLQLPDVREKLYVVMKTKEVTNKVKISRRKSFWNIFVKLLKIKNIEPLFDKEYFCNLDNKIYKYKCIRCDSNFEMQYHHPQNIYCNKHAYGSKAEFEISQFIKSLNINVVCNKQIKCGEKSHRELDVYVPDYNFGVEYDGLFWHSFCEKNYHINKNDFFNENKISVIRIFENEWLNKKQIVESIIRNKLGKIENRIYARECEIKEVDLKTTIEFLELNHLQGNCNSKIRIGLFNNNELIELITLGKSRFNKNYEYELLRSCSKINSIVIGGFDRLLKCFEEKYKPSSIITYSDLRYFNGNSYLKSGFQFLYRSEPDYFYFKQSDMILQHRSLFQKHKLAHILKVFDPNKTEYENMLDNGYLRIYDCGNNVFVKQNKLPSII